MNLLMVRHGEILSNIKKTYAGRSAEGLTPKGICQAEEVAERLTSYNVDIIYSSPIQRAVQTAEIIGKKIGKDIVIDNAFREMELGLWEGLSEDDIAQMYPGEWDIWNSRPAELTLSGRETLDELLKRVLTGLKEIYLNNNDWRIVTVTHVAIIRVVMLCNTKKSLNLYKTIHVPNADIFNFKIDICPSL
jgi:probable phosphoglycerate mutase